MTKEQKDLLVTIGLQEWLAMKTELEVMRARVRRLELDLDALNAEHEALANDHKDSAER
jgi:hypothetical protein